MIDNNKILSAHSKHTNTIKCVLFVVLFELSHFLFNVLYFGCFMISKKKTRNTNK